ncbi:MAG: polymer-forming cytoskeletal protein [Candidatus Falkowbacteria bacterium]|nr:polymer-forming cytoskeletal protein [Candidatus Falkowbacteria bacterium]
MKKIPFFVFSLIILLSLPAAAKAFSVESRDNIYVGKNETVDGNLYAAGQSITIDGTVNGDVIGAAQTITVNGTVNGDVIGAAQAFNFNGDVKGNIRAAANYLNINGSVGRNLNAFGAVTVLSQNSHIAWDALIFSNTTEVRGIIEGNLHGGVSEAVIAGKIGHDVDLKIDNKKASNALTIDKEAVIAGNLNYTSANNANIESQSSIAGQINRSQPEHQSFDWNAFIWWKIFGIFSALFIGLAIWFLWRNGVEKSLRSIKEKWGLNLLNGLIILALIPVASVILIVTLIGIPLAAILLLLGLVFFFLGKIISAIFVGHLLLKFITKKKYPVGALVIGVVVVWLFCAIPFIGWLISLAGMIMGGGALAETLKEKLA